MLTEDNLIDRKRDLHRVSTVIYPGRDELPEVAEIRDADSARVLRYRARRIRYWDVDNLNRASRAGPIQSPRVDRLVLKRAKT
jgi:hypothetical protein